MALLPDHARQRNNFEIIPLARPASSATDDRGLARAPSRAALLACRRSSTGAGRVRKARRHRTVGAGRAMTGVVLKHALSERGNDLYQTPPVRG